MKKAAFLLGVIVLFSACESKELKNKNRELQKRNTELMKESERKDSALYTFIYNFDKIEQNLEKIREKEKTLVLRKQGNEFSDDQAENIVRDINAIDRLLKVNEVKIGNLQKSLEAAEMENEELKGILERLAGKMQEKDKQISALQQELFATDKKLKDLYSAYNDRIEDLSEKESQLHTAYYAFGTYKELRDADVLTKEGGFIGIGRTERLQEDFNREYFTRIDTREVNSIPLAGANPELVTTHPRGSYHFEGEKEGKKLIIDDHEKFWSVSKFLVVTIE